MYDDNMHSGDKMCYRVINGDTACYLQQPSTFITFVPFIVIFNIPVTLGMGHISEAAYAHQDIQSHLTLALQNANISNYNTA